MKYFIQQKCPICDGHGNVAGGFYTALPGCPWSSSTIAEMCRNCKGVGVVYNLSECSNGEATLNRGEIILEKHINFEVAEKDEPEKMTWDEAMDKFKDNKDGWRLPTRIELLFMYEHREELGNLKKVWYWSSTTYINYLAYYQNFYNGIQYWDYRFIINRVRCVRDIKKEEK